MSKFIFPVFIALYIFSLSVTANAQEIDTIKLKKDIRRELDSIIITKRAMEESNERLLSYEENLLGLRVFKGKVQLRNKEVRNFLQQSGADVLKKYDRGRRTLICGDALAVAGLFSLGYGIFATVNAYNDEHGFDMDDRVLGYSLITGGAIAIAGGVLLFFNGQNKMKFAIKSYNDNVLVNSLQVGLTSNGLGLTLNF